MSSVALEPIFHSNPRRRIPKIAPKFRKSRQLFFVYSPKPLKIGGRIPGFGGARFSPVRARGNDDPSTVSGHGDDVVFSRRFPFRWTKTVEGKIYTRLEPGEKEGHWELTVGCNLPGRWILHWGVYLVGHDGSEWDQPPRQMRPPGSVAVEDYAVDTPMKAVTSKEEDHFQEVKIDINTSSPVASVNFVLRDGETGSWFQHMGGDFKVPLVGYLNDGSVSVPPKWGFSFFQDALGQLSGRLPKSKGDDPDDRQHKSPEVFYEEQHVLKEISLENSIKVSVRKCSHTAKNLVCIETDLPEDVVVQWCVCKDDQSKREIPALPHPPDTVVFQNKVLCTRLQPKKGGHGYRGIFTLEKDLTGFHFLIRLRDHNLKYMENEYFVPLQITSADQIEDREFSGDGFHDYSPQPNSGNTDQEIPESSTLYTDGLIKNIRDLVSDISSEKGSIRKSKDNQENLLSEIEKLAAEAYSIFRTNIPGFPEATKYSGSRSGLPSVKLHSGTGTGYEILCQGFNWESNKSGKWYMELREKADYLSALGFTIIWLPPPTESISPEGYMPKDLYNLNSKYGTVEELRAVIEKFHEVGIKVLGDVVLNHRCAQYQDHNGVRNVFGGRLNWDAHAIVGDDPHFHGKGNKSSGDNFHAAPNIDHSQDFVRRDIKEWMRWLKNEVGYDGWRLDFVRGFWGGYVKEYLDATEPYFAVGEYWDSLSYTYSEMDYDQNAHRQRIIDWINAAGGNAGAFDVTTKGVLHSSVENCQYWRLRDPKGKPPGVVGWWPSRAVTFIENHDTGSTQGHWRFPSGREMQGYAYILTHPGTPSIFYDHFYSSLHEEICKLIYLRRRNKLHCRSNVKIVKAETDVYAAIIDEKVAMKIGPGHYEPPSDRKWSKSLEGNCYKVWETTLTESKRTGTRSAKHR